MTVEDRDTTAYLQRARERIRRRSAAWMALIIAPLVILSAILKVFQRHDYPQATSKMSHCSG